MLSKFLLFGGVLGGGVQGHLFNYETIQLTNNHLTKIHPKSLNTTSLFSPRQQQQTPKPLQRCKTYPGDLLWPGKPIWDLFNLLLGKGSLIKTIPEASVCYPEWAGSRYSPAQCEELTKSWNNSTLRIEDPTSIRSILFQGMTSSNLNIRLVIKNTGHDFGGKSTGKGAINLWTHHLKDAEFYPEYHAVGEEGYDGPAFKFGAGVQVYEAYALAKKYNVTVIGGEGKSVGFIGGYIQGGGHSPLTSIYGMAADHILSIQVVTADGRFITADSTQNTDLVWALRGGGAATFGVVTSMVLKAFPRIKTTTLTYNFTTGGNFTREKMWEAHRLYVDGFERYADLGYYSYYRIRHVSGELYHDMTSMVAPNTTEKEFREVMKTLWDKWEEIGVPFSPVTWGMRQARRFLPRGVISDPKKRKEIMDAIKGVSDEGANILMFNMRNPPGSERVPNAVNKAWRDILGFAIMFVNWNVATDSGEWVETLSRNLTYEWNPRWKKLTPGSGTYMSESDYIEPDWQESFHGDKYWELLRIKEKWDPEGVFYATNAVGSEKWELEEVIMGHLLSQNSRLCSRN
ncbi:FAD binding domain-containing protein [Podospora fimiseda]|uniref:FAD binding domain-containing protein n=1 Tax=Podospora fimiseda TaxID=252190 RepID=A0AAN6YS97_9PEZI|nr:FAD binding domain-containing protein [Podospora fimiseda]